MNNPTTREYDIVIIGGGINGVAIARDAAGRGLRTLLCEKGDLASATSSASSKLIHGGLRYLEHLEFKLVRSALLERSRLLINAPHLVTPQEFIMPYHRSNGRSKWIIRAGLCLYDILSSASSLERSSFIKLNDDFYNNRYQSGFRFWDAWGDDARLVISQALAAAELGSDIMTRTEFIDAKRRQADWVVTLKNKNTFTITTKVLINAAGPWVDQINQINQIHSTKKCRLVKGSHLVVPKLYSGDHALLLQNHDKRVVFVVPYFDNFHLIGTTEQEYNGDPNKSKISEAEIQYLLDCVNRYTSKTISPNLIQTHFSGVRPLQDDGDQSASSVTRDHHIELNCQAAPYVSIYGGKLTTHRLLAEEVMSKLKFVFPTLKSDWTAEASLPGGNFAIGDKTKILRNLEKQFPWLSSVLISQLFARYGMRTYLVLDDANCIQDMGVHFGNGLYEREVRYLIETEWAITVSDIIKRRTKHGLYFNEKQIEDLKAWLSNEIVL